MFKLSSSEKPLKENDDQSLQENQDQLCSSHTSRKFQVSSRKQVKEIPEFKV